MENGVTHGTLREQFYALAAAFANLLTISPAGSSSEMDRTLLPACQ